MWDGREKMNLRIRTLALLAIGGLVALVATIPATAAGGANAPLLLESKIPLGEIRGRIDHLTVDFARQRLFVAELGNDSVGVVDLAHHTVLRTLTGLHAPQGVGYEPTTDMLYVANAGDGSVRLFQGAGLIPAGRIELGEDADNIRIDSKFHRVVVGYGKGALAIIDPRSRKKIADIKLKGHPESLQLAANGREAFVNVPDAHEIAAIDLSQGRQTAGWSLGLHLSNYPMTLDQDGDQVHVVFRRPASLVAFDTRNGKTLYSIETCGDSDDLFLDSKRARLYISCGEGLIDVIANRGKQYVNEAQLSTVGGARTSLFVPELDRYFLAVRASAQEPAAIWIFQPTD
jgi:hypothetical protein